MPKERDLAVFKEKSPQVVLSNGHSGRLMAVNCQPNSCIFVSLRVALLAQLF